MKEFYESKIDAGEMAQSVSSKPSFAMEILLNSTQETGDLTNKDGEEKNICKEYTDWEIPSYIKEGLRWLKAG